MTPSRWMTIGSFRPAPTITRSRSVTSARFGSWKPLRLVERSAVVVAIVRYEAANALTPIMRDRYLNLARFVKRGGKRSIRSVNRSIPRGLDLAAAVLRFQGVDETRIQAWSGIDRRAHWRQDDCGPPEASMA